MPIYNYACECGAAFEKWNSISDRQFSGCDCGALATKVIAPCAFYLDPVSGDFPTRTSNWAQAREKANWDELRRLGLRESDKRIYT